MNQCSQCKQELAANIAFCTRCGAQVSMQGAGFPDESGVTEEDLTLFMGKNAHKYLGKFQSFALGGDSFALTWHWPAFFVGFWWMLYRKLWLWAVLWLFLGLVLQLIPYAGFVMMLVSGMTANYLYYTHAKKKLVELKTLRGSDSSRAVAIARAGGVSGILVVIAPLVIIAVVAVLAAIAIPQFAMYRQKAGNVQAKQEIEQACSVGQTIFRTQPEKAQVVPDDLLYAGLVRTAEVDMTLLDGRRETFGISAKHVKGSKTYYTDRDCAVREEEPSGVTF
jgi:Tfp pilus assembly protein PilE